MTELDIEMDPNLPSIASNPYVLPLKHQDERRTGFCNSKFFTSLDLRIGYYLSQEMRHTSALPPYLVSINFLE